MVMNARQKKYYDKIRAIVEAKGGEVLSDYIGANEYIKIKCKKGHIWDTTPNSIKKHWCGKCHGNTPEQGEANFRARVVAQGGTVLGQYVNSKTKVKVMCEFGDIWDPIPNNITSGKWCDVCGYIDDKAREKFYLIVQQKGGRVIGQYVDAKTYIAIICKADHVWDVKPYCINGGQWCRICAGLDNDIAREDFYALIAKLNGKLKDEYVNCKTRVTIICEDGHEWMAEPDLIKSGNGAPL